MIGGCSLQALLLVLLRAIPPVAVVIVTAVEVR